VKKEEGDKAKLKASSREGASSVNPSPSASPSASSADDSSTTKKIEMAHQRSSSILERLRMKNEGKSTSSSQVVKSSASSGSKQLTISSFLKPKAEAKVTEENWLDSLIASKKNKASSDSVPLSKPPTPKSKAKAKAKARRKSPARGKKSAKASSSSEVTPASSAEGISSDEAPDSPAPRSRRPARAAAARAASKKLIASSDSSSHSAGSDSESAPEADSPLSDFSDISDDRPKKKRTLKRKVSAGSPAKPTRKAPAGGRKRRKVVRLDSDDESDEDYNDDDNVSYEPLVGRFSDIVVNLNNRKAEGADCPQLLEALKHNLVHPEELQLPCFIAEGTGEEEDPVIDVLE
ncbi:DNA topoisomerase 2, partial [Perkinsus olseni]